MATISPKTPRRAKPPSEPPGTVTRGRLLDAAEQLFAQTGFRGVSLREIVSKAAVNVAAAHYHFGSKQQLFEQVFARAAQPVKERTMQLLAAAQEHSDHPEFLEQIVRALIVPGLEAGSLTGSGNRNYSKLRAHLFLEDRAFAHTLFRKFYEEVSQRSIESLHRALPNLHAGEIAWRFHVLLGTLVFTTLPAGRVHPFARRSYQPEDADEAIEFLVPLLISVFRAPPIRDRRETSRGKKLAAKPAGVVKSRGSMTRKTRGELGIR